jgi:hypothetical protein
VKGRVTYNGKPLPSGTVTFVDTKGGVETSWIDSQGNYHIPRVAAGAVQVTVQTPSPRRLPPHLRPTASPEERAAAERDGAVIVPSVPIPQRYSDPKESGLTYQVASGAQTFDIDLKP